MFPISSCLSATKTRGDQLEREDIAMKGVSVPVSVGTTDFAVSGRQVSGTGGLKVSNCNTLSEVMSLPPTGTTHTKNSQ